MRTSAGMFNQLGYNYDDACAVAFGKAEYKELSPGAKVLFIGVVFPLFYIIFPIVTFLGCILFLAFKPISWVVQSLKQLFVRFGKQ